MKYDITFIGHMCYDEIIPYKGRPNVAPGSAVLCGSMVAAKIGKKVAIIVKMSPEDERILKPLKELGVDTFLIPSKETTYSRVIHESENIDERRMIIIKNAGLISINDIPRIDTEYVHLAGISDAEFDIKLIRKLKERGHNLSVDMQSFVRQVDKETKEISFSDVKDKEIIISYMNKVKLDIVEAKLLTGTDDLEKAAIIVEKWGCPEIVITHSEGVLARVNGKTYYEAFSNRSIVGRTGRGDTTFAAYTLRRLDHNPEDSLKFASALVSIKMESPGPFSGTIEDVLIRMEKKHM